MSADLDRLRRGRNAGGALAVASFLTLAVLALTTTLSARDVAFQQTFVPAAAAPAPAVPATHLVTAATAPQAPAAPLEIAAPAAPPPVAPVSSSPARAPHPSRTAGATHPTATAPASTAPSSAPPGAETIGESQAATCLVDLEGLLTAPVAATG